MARERQKIEVNALREGMFVSDLDRPWHETPFPLQGFYIRTDDEVKDLARYCRHVYIDVRKQRISAYTKHAPFSKKQAQVAPAKAKTEQSAKKELKLPAIVIKNPQRYEVSAPLRKEVNKIRKLHEHVYEALSDVFSAVEMGDFVSLKETEKVADGMVDSVLRNPDALVWLSRMHEQDTHSYQHGIRAAIWSLVFGRHLGLEKKALKTLAIGVLLMQIGKLKVDASLLENPDALKGEARREYESYVEKGLEALRAMGDLSRGVLTIAEFHCERHNGSGFPKGITGDRIPLLAKIAGLVDTYQGLIDPRSAGDPGLSPLDAAGKLYEMRNITFQQDLIERFIEAIGVYPTGTLVELSSGEVAIVTAHNQQRRLMPEVMVVCDASKQQLKSTKVIDLMSYNAERQKGQMLLIKDSLPKGAFGIDESRYLAQGMPSRWSLRHLAGNLMAS